MIEEPSLAVFVTLILIIGVNLVLWSALGIARFVDETLARRRGPGRPPGSPRVIVRRLPLGRRPRGGGVHRLHHRRGPRHQRPPRAIRRAPAVTTHTARRADIPTPADVAVLVAAHDEEPVIAGTLATARTLVPAANIYVVSDGSSDRTAEVARAAGVNVLELAQNIGKGSALTAGIERFELCRRYKVVLLLDADAFLSPDYLETGLPLFADPDVAAVAGRARTIWRPNELSLRGQVISAYREWLYTWLQDFIKYGQAWRHADAVAIVPGFASMYRTDVLAQIEVNAPGLVIEDFNMTFAVHHQRLGRVAFHPRAAVAYTDDPETMGDYVKQVKRWMLGLWQTVRRYGLLNRGRFWVALTLFLSEAVTSAIFALIAPLVLAAHLGAALLGYDAGLAPGVVGDLFQVFTIQAFALAVLLPQYLFTVLVASIRRRPRYLLLGLCFPFLRILDAALGLYMIPKAWTVRSTGAWQSPTRRPTAA